MPGISDREGAGARLVCALLALLFLAVWHAGPALGAAARAGKQDASQAGVRKRTPQPLKKAAPAQGVQKRVPQPLKKAAPQAGVRKRAAQASKKGVRAGAKVKKAARARPMVQEGGDGLYCNVKAAFLVNMTNGQVYYAQDPDEPIAPASVTKVLTLYLVREAMAQGRLRPSTPIPVSAAAVRTGGSTMRLLRGEKAPLTEIIKGISVVSANNACVAVAEYLGGGDSRRFVAQMNARAKSLGMSRSRFVNPNGLPAPGQVSTARDIAKLSMAYLRRFPESLAIHSMTSHSYHGVPHHNANSLLGRYEGVDGLKTGFVCSSGYNITATAKRGNTRLVAVVLGARSPIVREVETAKLLEYGFAKAAQAPAARAGSAAPGRAKKR